MAALPRHSQSWISQTPGKANFGETQSCGVGKLSGRRSPAEPTSSRVLRNPLCSGTMSRNSQRFFTGPQTGVPPSYEMLKEEHEVAVLGTPQVSAPVTTTVVNIQPETAVPDHIVWSLFNTLFFNVCCLGFVAFAYSVKSRDRKMVGDVTGAQSYASTAKCLNVWALVLGLLIVFGMIIAAATTSIISVT